MWGLPQAWMAEDPRSSSQHAPRGASEQVGGLCDARGERRLGLASPRAGVVGGLAADVAVDPQDAVVVGEDVVGDRARVRVLGFGVDVDLHDAVADRGADLVVGGAAAAVEDVVEAGSRM